ncbi:MAG: glycerate kinase [Firmicutes bacterium]|nr:glycerate kinase [Bacillota bacterium]
MMTRVLIAPERFYPTMKAQAVAQAMARGLESVSREWELVLFPMGSGGSGTTELAVRLASGRLYHETLAIAPRRTRDVRWGLLPDGTAIFDARDALGSPDGPSQLNQAYVDSRPLGQMIQQLIARRPRRIVIALGDVLAADGGMGVLQHFGIKACDAANDVLGSGTQQLLRLHHVDFGDLTPPEVPLVALTDHTLTWNERVQQEDFRLDLIHGGLHLASERFRDLLADHVRVPLGEVEGSGGGGGLGMALAFLGAQFQCGAEYLAQLGALKSKLWDVDWVMTGTHTLGPHSATQAVGIVARHARDAGIPAIALTCDLRPGHLELLDLGLTGIYPVLDRVRNHKELHRTLPALIEHAAFRAGYWVQALSEP